MTVSDKDMEGYARDCVRLAQLSRDPKVREQLLQMAREWMAEAMHESELGRSPISHPQHLRAG
jgi:hypothetical protein